MEGRVEAGHRGQVPEQVADRPDRRQRLGLVQRREVRQLRKSRDDVLIERHGPEKALSPVHHPMRDHVGLAQRPSIAAARAPRSSSARGARSSADASTASPSPTRPSLTLLEPALTVRTRNQRASDGVPASGAGNASGQVQSLTSGGSSPSSRV